MEDSLELFVQGWQCERASMLPVTFQFIIAMVAYALNERMARRLDYLQEESAPAV